MKLNKKSFFVYRLKQLEVGHRLERVLFLSSGIRKTNYWSFEAWKALNIKEVPYLAVRWQYIKCAVF